MTGRASAEAADGDNGRSAVEISRTIPAPEIDLLLQNTWYEKQAGRDSDKCHLYGVIVIPSRAAARIVVSISGAKQPLDKFGGGIFAVGWAGKVQRNGRFPF